MSTSTTRKLGCWHNGSTFVFCVGDCPFEFEPTSTSADVSGEVTGCDTSCQEVSRCSTRGISQRMYITFASAKMWTRQNPLWLWNPEEMSPEIQNRDTSGPKIGLCMCPPKDLKIKPTRTNSPKFSYLHKSTFRWCSGICLELPFKSILSHQ